MTMLFGYALSFLRWFDMFSCNIAGGDVFRVLLYFVAWFRCYMLFAFLVVGLSLR